MKDYIAFISYSHSDSAVADKLQKRLEQFHVPVALREANPGIPEKITPVFKDDTDLSAGTLSDHINLALDNSEFLIVICSPRSAQSPWVDKEVSHFMKEGDAGRIVPVIVDCPDGDPAAVLPKPLRQLDGDSELLWINLKNDGLDKAVVKIIARILNVTFDSLWQRHERIRKSQARRRLAAGVISALVVLLSVVFGVSQCQRLDRKEHRDRQNRVAAEAATMIDNGNLLGAMRLLTAGDGNLLEPYNSRIDSVLRTAIMRYGQPGWKCVEVTDADPGQFAGQEGYTVSYDYSAIDVIDPSGNRLKTVSLADSMDLIMGAALSASGKTLAFRHSRDTLSSVITVIDAGTEREIRSFEVPCHNVEFDLTGDGTRIVLAVDGVVEVRDIATDSVLHRLASRNPDEIVGSVRMLNDSIAMIAALTTAESLIYNVDTGLPLTAVSDEIPVSVAFSEDGDEMTLLCTDGMSRRCLRGETAVVDSMFQPEFRDFVFAGSGSAIPEGSAIFPNADGRLIACVDTTAAWLEIWESDAAEPLKHFPLHEECFVWEVAFSADDSYAALLISQPLDVIEVGPVVSIATLDPTTPIHVIVMSLEDGGTVARFSSMSYDTCSAVQFIDGNLVIERTSLHSSLNPDVIRWLGYEELCERAASLVE